MSIGPLAFLSPWLLAGLVALPIIYWLLRTVPPRPSRWFFRRRGSSSGSRMWRSAGQDTVVADADPASCRGACDFRAGRTGAQSRTAEQALAVQGRWCCVVDNSWAAASGWTNRMTMVERLIGEAQSASRSVIVAPTALTSRKPVVRIEAPKDASSTAAALSATTVCA